MTDSIDEKPTPRQPRLSPQTEDFDFELVELSAISDNDKDALDPVDANASQESRITPNNFNANESLMPPPAQIIPEIKTNFYVDYFDKRKKVKTANSEPVPVAEENKSSSVDNRSQDAMTTETEPLETESFYTEPSPEGAPVVNGAGMAVAVLSQFKSKQESINKQQEKLIQEFSQKVKTATTVTYTAVFFGVASLAAAATLGFMLLQTKSEVSDLVGTTTALKDDIRNIKTAPDDLEGTDPSIDQLSQKVEDVAGRLNEVTVLQNKVALLEKAAATKTSSKSQDRHAQTTTDVVEKKPSEAIAVAAVKPTPVTKAAKNTNAPQVIVTDVSPTTAKPQNVTKPANKATVTTKKDHEIPDKAVNVPPVNDINKVVNSTSPQTVSGSSPQVNTNTSSQTGSGSSGGWTVNLASSNRLEDAKKSAASYAQKGVPVTISPVTVKNETRYRLQVKGFKTKEEAAAYANKAKDMLKLNSVWINP